MLGMESRNSYDSDLESNKLLLRELDGIRKRTDESLNYFNTINRKNLFQEPREEPKATIAKAKASTQEDPSGEKNSDDLIKTIAFNSREIRLVGPDQKEVEMKDDVGTKMMIALENLSKEATEVWGQVNEKLDKGWTELKTAVETALAPKQKSSLSSQQNYRNLREAPSKSQLVVPSDFDGYSFADEPSSAGKQLEEAGTKIKGFFSENLGLNEENRKKAADAISKAGDSVSETMTKDLPDALKKAGSAVSDTVTKDIPDAFKNFFG